MAGTLSIKRKLTLNIAIVLATILCVAAAGVVGMSQVRSRLLELTERSTPFQVRTLEVQRAVQGATAELDRMCQSRTRAEYLACLSSTARAMDEADSAAASLSLLTGGDAGGGDPRLRDLANELRAVTGRRLESDSAAVTVSRQMGSHFAELNRQVEALNSRVRSLQSTQQAAFTTASTEATRSSQLARSIEQVKTGLLELQVAVLDLQGVQGKSAVTIAKARLNTLVNRINQNEALTADKNIASGTKDYLAQVAELGALKQSLLEAASGEGDGRLEALNKRLKESFAVVMLAIGEATTQAVQRNAQAQERQGRVMQQTGQAGTVLVQASRFVALGQGIESLTQRLFSATGRVELDSLQARLTQHYSEAEAIARTLAQTLEKLDASTERRQLEAARAGLAQTRTLLLDSGGVLERVRLQLDMAFHAAEASERLRDLVAEQAEQGRSTVSTAKGEQEESIRSVNRTVWLSLLLILVISCAALAFGVIFGTWVYRSIAGTLSSVQLTVEEVETRADFSRRVAVDGQDEVGRMATAFNNLLAMLQEALGEVSQVMAAMADGDFARRVHQELPGDLGSLKEAVNTSASRVQALLGNAGQVALALSHGDLSGRVRAEGRGELADLREHLNQSLDSLSTTLSRIHGQADQVEAAARSCSQRVEHISTDAREQVRHVDDVCQRVRLAAGTAEQISQHTHQAGQVSQEAVGLALDGRQRMERLVDIVNRIAASSEQVRGISDTIGHLAAKTRMLSLNATIEAARAGEAGRGFAVVADEVGRLADSSAGSSKEISDLVRQAADEAAAAVSAVGEVRSTLDDIARGAQRTDDMLGRVSQALDLQREALQGIEGSVSALEGISSRNADTASEISGTMGELTHLAAATNREVELFTLS